MNSSQAGDPIHPTCSFGHLVAACLISDVPWNGSKSKRENFWQGNFLDGGSFGRSAGSHDSESNTGSYGMLAVLLDECRTPENFWFARPL